MKIAVHLHLFYFNQLDYFLKKIRNITCDWDLIVTTVEENEEIAKKIKAFKPDAQILLVENLGYDIYPYICFLNHIDLAKYDYLLKLHTKAPRKVWGKNKKIYKGYDWRNSLVNSLIGSKKTFEKNIKLFQDEKTGMVADCYLIMKHEKESFFNRERTNALVKKYSLNIKNAHFVAGTMFFIRTDIAKKILDLGIKKEDFVDDTKSHSADSGKFAHSIETVLGDVVNTMDYKITGTSDKAWVFLFMLKQIFYGMFSIWQEGGHASISVLGLRFRTKFIDPEIVQF